MRATGDGARGQEGEGKKKRVKENGKIGKRNEEKEDGEKGKRERKRRGAVRASGDRGRGRPRVASSRVCGPREMGHAARRGGRKKERGKKIGQDSRRPDATRRVGWEKDGT